MVFAIKAVYLYAIAIENHMSMILAVVFSHLLGFALEEEQKVVDLSFWEKNGSKITACMAVELLKIF